MLTISNPLLDDACTAFVHWLTQRTQQGRAHWLKQPNGLISHLPGSMFAQFITHPDGLGQQAWRLLTVRDNNGELLRATPPTTTIDERPLAHAADALFIAITHPTSLSTTFH
jgi:hypothetical protein